MRRGLENAALVCALDRQSLEYLGLQDFVFTSADEPLDVLLDRVTLLTDPGTNAAYRWEIGQRLEAFQAVNAAMWNSVTEALAGRL